LPANQSSRKNLPRKVPLGPQAAIFLGVLAISTGSIFARLAQQEAPSLVVATYRMVLATLFFLPWAVTKYRQVILGFTKKQVLLILLSGFFLALHFATWITSLEYTTVASSVVLVTTVPLWVAIISTVFLKEKPGSLLMIGLFVALIGGVIVSMGMSCYVDGTVNCSGFSEFFHGRYFYGNLLALAGAWAASGYMVIGRKVRATVDVVPYAFAVYGFSAIILLITSIVLGLNLTGYSNETYLWLVALAFFPQVVGHSTYNWALGYLPVTYVAVVLLGEPIGASILALIFLGEIPSFIEVIGGLLILLGIYLASLTPTIKDIKESQ
jgi:drug/metabolite transporter (DMT)-like permease